MREAGPATRRATQDGYPSFFIPGSVTSFTGYGMGSYSYFDQGMAIENAMAVGQQTPGRCRPEGLCGYSSRLNCFRVGFASV